jgi:hypothetical protein
MLGVHTRFVIQGEPVNCNIVDFAVPFQDTVIRAVSSFSTALMYAWKVWLLCPAGMEKAVGTLTLPVLLSTDIVIAEVEGTVRVTAQLTAPSVSNLPGGQTTPLKLTAVVRLTVEYTVRSEVAEIVTLWEEISVAAVAVNDAEFVPASTVTVDGTVSATLLDCRGTMIMAGTAPLNVMEQVALCPGPSVDGVQPIDVNVGGPVNAGGVSVKLTGTEDPTEVAVTVTLCGVETAATVSVKEVLD